MTRSLSLLSLAFASVLFLSLRSDSLWTDEAFSAYLASQHSLHSLLHTLWTGDSSDLQMPGYYLYLYLWAQVFPVTEFSLRAANAPFLLLFSVSLVYGSFSAFRSRFAWLTVACLPFIWHYAGEARAYMAILAFSTAAFGSLLSFSETKDSGRLRILPWLCFGSLLIGSFFHMLCLLAVPPLLSAFCILALTDKPRERWRYWLRPALILSAPFTLLLLYFAYTFARGTHYLYPAPGWRQMLSVVYELAGFSGLGPNLKLSINFAPYAGLLATGAILFVFGIACAVAAAGAASGNSCRKALAVSAAAAVLQAALLAVALHQQFDARHCAALIPAFLFLYISSITHYNQQHAMPVTAIISGVLLAGMWMMSDIRLLFLPEYRKEDYKTAIQIAMNFARQQHASIALFADPLAGAYYGLDPQGPAPCFPLLRDCSTGLQLARWSRPVTAAFAQTWSPARLQSWIQDNRMNGRPVALIFELDRSNRKLPWWPALESPLFSQHFAAHGFAIATVGEHSTP